MTAALALAGIRPPVVRVAYLGGQSEDVAVPASAVHIFESAHGPLRHAMASGSSLWLEEVTHTALVRLRGEHRPLAEWLAHVEALVDVTPSDAAEERPPYFGGPTDAAIRTYARTVAH